MRQRARRGTRSAESATLRVRHSTGPMGAALSTVAVLVDGLETARVRPGGTATIPLAPGRHSVDAITRTASSATLTLDVRPHEEIALTVRPSSPAAGFLGKPRLLLERA